MTPWLVPARTELFNLFARCAATHPDDDRTAHDCVRQIAQAGQRHGAEHREPRRDVEPLDHMRVRGPQGRGGQRMVIRKRAEPPDESAHVIEQRRAVSGETELLRQIIRVMTLEPIAIAHAALRAMRSLAVCSRPAVSSPAATAAPSRINAAISRRKHGASRYPRISTCRPRTGHWYAAGS